MKAITKNMLTGLALVLALQSVSTVQAADPRQWGRGTRAAAGTGLLASLVGLGFRTGLFSSPFRYRGWYTNISAKNDSKICGLNLTQTDTHPHNVLRQGDPFPADEKLCQLPLDFQGNHAWYNSTPCSSFNELLIRLDNEIDPAEGNNDLSTDVAIFIQDMDRLQDPGMVRYIHVSAEWSAVRPILAMCHRQATSMLYRLRRLAPSFIAEPMCRILLCVDRADGELYSTTEIYSIDHVDPNSQAYQELRGNDQTSFGSKLPF